MPTAQKTSDATAIIPGGARNIPITAVKTISETTRGLVSAKNCCSRREKARRATSYRVISRALPVFLVVTALG